MKGKEYKMKNIYAVLKGDLIAMRRVKDTTRVKFYSFLLGEVDRAGKDHSDEAVTKILSTVQKQLAKSAVPNELEIRIIGNYLPRALTKEEVGQYLMESNLMGQKMGDVVKSLNAFAKDKDMTVNGAEAVSLIKLYLGK
jgi:uncharacterized protein YqeY